MATCRRGFVGSGTSSNPPPATPGPGGTFPLRPLVDAVRRRCHDRPYDGGGGAVRTRAAAEVAAARRDRPRRRRDSGQHRAHVGEDAGARPERLLGRAVHDERGRAGDDLRLEQLRRRLGPGTALGELPRVAAARPRALDRDGAALDARTDLARLRIGFARVLQPAGRAPLRPRRGSELGSLGGGRDHARVRASCGGQPRQPPVERARLGTEASSMQVCARTKSGQLSPGAEDPARYDVNPGEGWAETFRVLNQRRLGVAESPWEIVTQSLYPTAAVLSAAEQDVVDPWRAGTSTAQTGAVPR